MLTENGVNVDLEAVHGVLRQADLLTVAFATFPERLLVDTRADQSQGPMAAVVPPVASVQERYLWLGQHRGRFGAPRAFSSFAWPRTVRSLVEEDVLGPLRARMEAAWPGAGAALDEALAELLDRERRAMIGAVRGDGGWQPLWEHPRTHS